MEIKYSIEIMNLHSEKCSELYDVKVCRYKSILGNPYVMTQESQRNEACDKYEMWFKKQSVNLGTAFQNEIDRLLILLRKHKRLRLFCWCAPYRCHAETIRDYLLREIQTDASKKGKPKKEG